MSQQTGVAVLQNISNIYPALVCVQYVSPGGFAMSAELVHVNQYSLNRSTFDHSKLHCRCRLVLLIMSLVNCSYFNIELIEWLKYYFKYDDERFPGRDTGLCCTDFSVLSVLFMLCMPLLQCCIKCLSDIFTVYIQLVDFAKWCISVKRSATNNTTFLLSPLLWLCTDWRGVMCVLFCLSLLSIKAFFCCQWRG